MCDNKFAYDMALHYAQACLISELSHKGFDKSNSEAQKLDYMYECFYSAYSYFTEHATRFDAIQNG